MDVGELSAAATLLLVAGVDLDRRLQRLAVRNARLVAGDLDGVPTSEALQDDVEVHLAHPLEDHLVGLCIVVEMEGRVFLVQLVQALGDLVVLAVVDGLEGDPAVRRRVLDRREHRVHTLVGQRIAADHAGNR